MDPIQYRTKILTPADISQRRNRRSDYTYYSRIPYYWIESQCFPYINTGHALDPHRTLHRHDLLFDSSQHEELKKLFVFKCQTSS